MEWKLTRETLEILEFMKIWLDTSFFSFSEIRFFYVVLGGLEFTVQPGLV